MANSTKKKYLPSPAMPLCKLSSRYIHHRRNNLEPMVENGLWNRKVDWGTSCCPSTCKKIPSQGRSNFHFIRCSYYPTQSIFFSIPFSRFELRKTHTHTKKMPTRNKIRKPGLLGKIHNKNCSCLFCNLQNNLIYHMNWFSLCKYKW